MTDLTGDVIDSRDMLERLQELEYLIEAYGDNKEAYDSEYGDLVAEKKDLEEAIKDAREICSDFDHGEPLIADDYFVKYAKELASDCGYEASTEWPERCIDWEMAADQLKEDYSEISLNETIYWIRSI